MSPKLPITDALMQNLEITEQRAAETHEAANIGNPESAVDGPLTSARQGRGRGWRTGRKTRWRLGDSDE